MTAEAERFIAQNKTKPCFLYLPYFTVHIPMKAKPELIAKYRGLPVPAQGQRNPVYAAMVESMDESIGRRVRKLEEAGVFDNPGFIFTDAARLQAQLAFWRSRVGAQMMSSKIPWIDFHLRD